jgi:putative ABC transport system substrate-binding protein
VVAAFRNGLGEAGFAEGRNVVIAFRWAEGRYDDLPALAAELVVMRVAVLFAAGGPPAALAAKGATQTIPVVFSAASDPVAIGLVQSRNRPGGNVTGMSTLTSPLAAKRIELLKELAPTAAVIAYLVNPSNPSVARCRRRQTRSRSRFTSSRLPQRQRSTTPLLRRRGFASTVSWSRASPISIASASAS